MANQERSDILDQNRIYWKMRTSIGIERTTRMLPRSLCSSLSLEPRLHDIHVFVFINLHKQSSSTSNVFENGSQVTVTGNWSQTSSIDAIQVECALTKLSLQCHSKLGEGRDEAINSSAMAISPVMHCGLLSSVPHDDVVSCESHFQLFWCWSTVWPDLSI